MKPYRIRIILTLTSFLIFAFQTAACAAGDGKERSLMDIKFVVKGSSRTLDSKSANSQKDSKLTSQKPVAGYSYVDAQGKVQSGVIASTASASSDVNLQKYSSFAFASHQKRESYAPNVLLVKFKEGVDSRSALQSISARYRLENVTRIFKDEPAAISTALKNKIKQRMKRVPKDKEEPKGLDRVYKIEFEKAANLPDMETLAEDIAKDPRIEYAEPDRKVYSHIIPNDFIFSPHPEMPGLELGQWNLWQIHAPQAWELETGSPSIVVAVLDSGIDYNHPDLAAKIVTGYDFANNDSNPMDDNGHGTAVAGILAADTDQPNGQGIAGVDWHAKLMPIKVINASGGGDLSGIAAGIRYAADHGADVINMSFGFEDPSTTLQSAVQYAFSHGCVLIAAMGNSGTDRLHYPVAYPEVIAVGGSDHQDSRVVTSDWASNFGSHLDVMAPGIDLASTISQPTCCAYGFGLGGTSGSAPQVSGLASLILAADRSLSLTNTAVRQIMVNAADDVSPSGFDIFTGYGRINARRAIESLIPNYQPASVYHSYSYCGSQLLRTAEEFESDCSGFRLINYLQNFVIGDLVYTGLHLASLTRPVKMKIEAIMPDGERLPDSVSGWMGPGPNLWVFIGHDFRPPFNPNYIGKWIFNYYLQEQVSPGAGTGVWDLVDSKTFTVNDTFTFVRAAMAEGVDTTPFYISTPQIPAASRLEPVGESDNFQIDPGESAYAWLHLTSVYKAQNIFFEWYRPDNSFFKTQTVAIPDPGSTERLRWSWYKVWDNVANFPSVAGLWRVKILAGDGIRPQAELLDEITFMVNAPPPPTYWTVSGYTRTAEGSGAASVSVDIASSTRNFLVYTDGSGFYSLAVPSDTYMITPSKPGFTFIPASRVVSVAGADQTSQNFTAVSPLPPDPANLTAYFVDYGWASFNLDWESGGGSTAYFKVAYNHTQTPPLDCQAYPYFDTPYSDANISIGPTPSYYSVRVCAVNGGGQASNGITGTWHYPPIPCGGEPVAALQEISQGQVGAPITFDGSSSYSPEGQIAEYRWGFTNGTIYTSHSSTYTYTFAESGTIAVELQVKDSCGQYSNWDFFIITIIPSSPQTFFISGHVRNGDGNGLYGIRVFHDVLEHGFTYTDESGYYEIGNVTNGTFTINANNDGMIFSPPLRTVTIDNSNATSQDFTAISGAYYLSGAVREPDGTGMGGVIISISGQGSVVTNSAGYYIAIGLPNVVYSLTPSKPGYQFSPSSYDLVTSPAMYGYDFIVTPSDSGGDGGGNGQVGTIEKNRKIVQALT